MLCMDLWMEHMPFDWFDSTLCLCHGISSELQAAFFWEVKLLRVHICPFAGFNLTLTLMGNNRTVQGAASEVPASSLQPVQPQMGSALDRLNLTLRLQGAGVVPFTPALQRELVSAILHVSSGCLPLWMPGLVDGAAKLLLQ